MIYRDSRRTPITEGAKVAYNLSGDVVSGVVLHVTRGGTTHIRCTNRTGWAAGRTSKVKNPGSVLVLLPEDNV